MVDFTMCLIARNVGGRQCFVFRGIYGSSVGDASTFLNSQTEMSMYCFLPRFFISFIFFSFPSDFDSGVRLHSHGGLELVNRPWHSEGLRYINKK